MLLILSYKANQLNYNLINLQILKIYISTYLILLIKMTTLKLLALIILITLIFAEIPINKELSSIPFEDDCNKVKDGGCMWNGFGCYCTPEFMRNYPCDNKSIFYLSSEEDCQQYGKSYDFPNGTEKLCCSYLYR
jgi:hypothetical protein